MTQTTSTTTVFVRLPHPHSIAIYLEFVAQETQIIPCTASYAMSFQSEDEARVLSIKAGERFYFVRSEVCNNWFYLVALVAYRGEQVWRCTCPSHKPCKHERKVQPVIQAQAAKAAAREAELRKLEAAAAIADIEAELAARQAAGERRRSAPLNGDRSFRLMR